MVVLLFGGVGASALFRPDLAARSAAGLTAHSLCSARFVSGQDVDTTFERLVAPLVGPVAPLISYQVNVRDPSVTARFAGMATTRASFTPGFGCRIEDPENTALATRPATDLNANTAKPLPVALEPALSPPINQVFAERAGAPPKRVIAVVVLRDGQLVGERYAPGYDAGTPLLGFSIAKSVTNALTGILVQKGRLRLDQTAVAAEWQGEHDARGTITVEDLLRMQSGLDAPEGGSASDTVTRMLYSQPDMAAFAAGRELKAPPGTAWDYTSANTLILSRLIGKTISGGPAALRAFAQQELFAPLGMANVTLEFDGAGTFIGSSYVYAPARSFARFGQLYLNDGRLEGRRVLPPGWVGWTRTSTLGLGYGAGFWTNDGGGDLAKSRVALGFPRDGFFASGNLGQRIYIVPSAGLVVARFGTSSPPDFGIEDDIALIAAAIRQGRSLEARPLQRR